MPADTAKKRIEAKRACRCGPERWRRGKNMTWRDTSHVAFREKREKAFMQTVRVIDTSLFDQKHYYSSNLKISEILYSLFHSKLKILH